MASPGNRPSSLLFFFSCICFFSLQAQQHPFFGRDQKKEKSKIQATPFFNGRVTAPDSIGFGGEPGIVWERLVKEVFPESDPDYVNYMVRLADGSFAICGGIYTSFLPEGFIMNVTAEGHVLWKKKLGVNGEGFNPSICATPDGGLLALGGLFIDSLTNVPVIKLSSSGEIEWQVTLTNVISPKGIEVCLSGDGGYVIGSVNKVKTNDSCSTSRDRDSLFSVAIKLDHTGTVVWNRKHFIGFSFDEPVSTVTKLSDGYLIMNSFGEAAMKCVPQKPNDLVLLKIDNNGNLVWLKKFGGSKNDFGYDVKSLPNSNLLVLGFTNSTDRDLLGVNTDTVKSVAWKMILNDSGKIVSNVVYNLSSSSDYFVKAVVRNDSTYVTVGASYFSNGYIGHLLSFDKNGIEQWRVVYPNWAITTIDSINKNEWMVTYLGHDEFNSFAKLGPASNITGSVYFDFNKNNIKDVNEPYANKFLVTSAKAGYTRSSVAFNGWFRNDVDTGTYKTTVKLLNDYYVPVPAEKQTTFTTLFQNDTIDFALQPVAGKRDVSINLIPVTPARPGFNAKYKLTFRNNGTDTIPNGGVLLIKDSKTTLLSSLPAAGLVTGDSILWGYAGFKPFDSYSFDIEVKLAAPPALNNGDSLRFKSFITSTTGSAAAVDLTPADDTSYVTQLVTGAYDPNDKHENVAGKIPLAKVASGENIQYVIRFQNTGTDTAFTVRITDTLDAKLNWNSLQMVAASHAYKMKVIDGNKITWTFDNINLPDSNVNEPLSNGYVAFTIKAKTTLASGDYFQNKASIYFDYNLPVITNTATTVVSSVILTNVRDLEDDDMQLLALPNPTTGTFYLKLSGDRVGKFEYSVVDLFGRVLQTGKTERNSRNDAQYIPLNLNNARAGVYYIVLRQKNTLWQQKLIVQ